MNWMLIPKCPKHGTTLICPSCMAQRSKGSPARIAASRAAGKLGGRPAIHTPNCELRRTGRFSGNCAACAKLVGKHGKKPGDYR